MDDYFVRMIREDMRGCPDVPFPAGFGIRPFRRGEGPIWTRIQQRAEPFADIDGDRFDQVFGEHLDALEDRSFFVVTADGDEIGTITAWWDPDWRGKEWGRIHWVAIEPRYQGRGLSKPAMSVAMKRLQESHERCYLGTTTGRLGAIKVYLDFGFCPDLDSVESEAMFDGGLPRSTAEVWTEVASVLEHPILKSYLCI